MSKRKYDLIDRKYQASILADKYYQLSLLRGRILRPFYLNYSNKIAQCANSALYIQKIINVPCYDGGDENIEYKQQTRLRLVHSSFCRIRLCPICQSRRAARSQAIALKIFPSLLEQLPAARYLFLTLTVKNCSITQLADRVRELNRSWIRLTQTKSFPALAWIKSLEVSIPNEKTVHPHFHCLLMVNEDYFNKENFLSSNWWILAWQKAAKLDYAPSVQIQAIQKGQEMAIIPELFKYVVKPLDLHNISLSDLHHLTRQMRGLKTFTKSGVFQNFFASINEDYSDLLGNNHNTDTVDITGYKMSLQFLPSQQAYQVDHWEYDTLCNREILNLHEYHQETLLT